MEIIGTPKYMDIFLLSEIENLSYNIKKHMIEEFDVCNYAFAKA